MIRIAAMRQLKYGGLAVAATGFALGRYGVAESARSGDTVWHFLLGQAPFLALGFGLAIVGVALAVSAHTAEEVNAVASWCSLGVGAMAAVLGLTRAEALFFGGEVGLSGDLAASLLTAGAVGGLITGLRSASNRRQRRALVNQADRLTALNRILRHEVLNRVNVIYGYADPDAGAAGFTTIRRSAARIEAAIADVETLTRPAARGAEIGAVPLRAALEAEMAIARRDNPEAGVRARGDLPEVSVRADAHLSTVFRHLLDNAIRYNDALRPSVIVAAEVRGDDVIVRVEDDGPGLPSKQQVLLDGGQLPEYDDPSVGFGLTVSRLLVDTYGGELRAETDDRGTAITLALPRAATDGTRPYGGRGVSTARLRAATAAALLAGVGTGAALPALGGDLAVVGALYGDADAAVGWLAHLFHSAVFGLLFAAATRRRSAGRSRGELRRWGLAGAAYGTAIWSTASALVAPLWLRSVGVSAAVPALDAGALFGHLAWGAALGVLFALLAGRD